MPHNNDPLSFQKKPLHFQLKPQCANFCLTVTIFAPSTKFFASAPNSFNTPAQSSHAFTQSRRFRTKSWFIAFNRKWLKPNFPCRSQLLALPVPNYDCFLLPFGNPAYFSFKYLCVIVQIKNRAGGGKDKQDVFFFCLFQKYFFISIEALANICPVKSTQIQLSLIVLL